MHAVVSEPGGNDEIVARLRVRGVTNLGFQVHSDPDNKLLLRTKDSIDTEAPLFVKKTQVTEKFDSKTNVPYVDYEMVQPALIVVDRSGAVKQFWSWKTGPTKDAEPKSEMTKVPGYGILVAVRPISADIGVSIRESRDVKLQFQGMTNLVSEMYGRTVFYAAAAFVVGVAAIAFMKFYK